jgi:hypothetical protein
MMDDDPAYQAALERAKQMLAFYAQQQALIEAELAAHGIHPVSVAHGDAADPAAAELIYEKLPALAREAGTLAGWRGGNDYTTYLFPGPRRKAPPCGLWPRCWRWDRLHGGA